MAKEEIKCILDINNCAPGEIKLKINQELAEYGNSRK
jgi:hypothetical protein